MKKYLIIVLGLLWVTSAFTDEIKTVECVEESSREFGVTQEKKGFFDKKEKIKLKVDLTNHVLLEIDGEVINRKLVKYSEKENKQLTLATNIIGKTIYSIKIISIIDSYGHKNFEKGIKRIDPILFEYSIYIYPQDIRLAQMLKTFTVKQFEEWFKKNNSNYQIKEKSWGIYGCV